MAESPTDWRHYDVVHKRCHDFPESRANDDTDGHIQYIAAHRKFFEFLEAFQISLQSLLDSGAPGGAGRRG